MHARRHFVEVVKSFPTECRYVLETVGSVFYHDALAREEKMTPDDRLLFHQQKSLPLMEGLHDWCRQHMDERKVGTPASAKRFSICCDTGRNRLCSCGKPARRWTTTSALPRAAVQM